MTTIGLATWRGHADLTEDDQRLGAELRRRGLTVRPVVWDAGPAELDGLDALVIRSCWDYHLRLSEFLAWLDDVEARAIPTWNPLPVVRWNTDKVYLRELESRGVPILPTAWVDPARPRTCGELLDEHGWSKVVVKPAVSASAHHTHVVTDRQEGDARLRELLRNGSALVQEFAPEIPEEGEWSLVFFGEELSHAVVKRPAPGDFRSQAEYGGVTRHVEPPAELVDHARRVLAASPGPRLLARVDGVHRDSRLLLVELELIEPFLFLGHAPGAVERFADAIESVLA